jgi:hypothetical protein
MTDLIPEGTRFPDFDLDYYPPYELRNGDWRPIRESPALAYCDRKDWEIFHPPKVKKPDVEEIARLGAALDAVDPEKISRAQRRVISPSEIEPLDAYFLVMRKFVWFESRRYHRLRKVPSAAQEAFWGRRHADAVLACDRLEKPGSGASMRQIIDARAGRTIAMARYYYAWLRRRDHNNKNRKSPT